MDELHIRPGELADFHACLALSHTNQTGRIWQMDFGKQPGVLTARFQTVRLPKLLEVVYPYTADELVNRWYAADYFQVAEQGEQLVGYLTLMLDTMEAVAWLGDMAIDPVWRRKGYGSQFLVLAKQWAKQEGARRFIGTASTKNYPATLFYEKNGLVFCGYNELLHSGEILLHFGSQ